MGFYGSYGDLMFETCELDMLKLKPPTMIQFLSCLWLYHNNTLIWNKNDQPISNENPQVVFWPPSDWNPFAWIPAEQIASSSDPLGPQLCPVRPMTISISIATPKKVYNIEKKLTLQFTLRLFILLWGTIDHYMAGVTTGASRTRTLELWRLSV